MIRNGIRDWAVALVVGYIIVATLVFRFANPHLTETELFLNIPKALLFQNP
jgi:hypothetical protein